MRDKLNMYIYNYNSISFPKHLIKTIPSRESMIIDQIKTCSIIMNLPGQINQTPAAENLLLPFRENTSLSAHNSSDTASGSLPQDSILEWDHLEKYLSKIKISALIADFPWLRKVNSPRFCIGEFRRRFRSFLIKMHPSAFIRHWGDEPKAYMKSLNSFLDSTIQSFKSPESLARNLAILNDWYSEYIEDLNFLEFKSFFMENAPECNEFIESSNPFISREERSLLKKTLISYLRKHVPGGADTPENSGTRRADWIMAYNNMVISMIAREPGLEGVLVNLIIGRIPAARHVFTLLPFPIWGFLNDIRLLRLFTVRNPADIIGDMIKDLDISFPQYREHSIINLNLFGSENTGALNSLLEFMSDRGVPRACATDLVYSSCKPRARHNHIRNRTITREVPAESPPTREHVLSDSFLNRATAHEISYYCLAIDILRKIIGAEQSITPESRRDSCGKNSGKLNPARFPLSLKSIPLRTRRNIDPSGHHNMPFSAILFTCSMMTKVANLDWAIKTLTRKDVTCREKALMTGIVNRTVGVLQRHLNDQNFRPYQVAEYRNRQKRRAGKAA